MNVEEALSATVAGMEYHDLPETTIKNTKRLLFDTVGGMFAGSSQEGAAAIAKWATRPGGGGEATVCSFSGMGRATDVAVANGYMAHALEYDDTHDAAQLHTGVTVIPAVLAAAECYGIGDGQHLIESIVCGTEVMSRLGLGCLNSPFEYGWMYTSVQGAIGAAAAVAKLLGGVEEDIWNAMGIAYSEAAGNCQTSTDGALAKRLQPGLAAGSGVRAAELALAGLTGSREFVDGKYGLASLYFRGQYDSSRVVRGLGSEWQVDQLSYKLYPCCRVSHGAIDLVLAAIEAGKLRPETLRSMRIGTSPGGQKDLGEPPEQKRRPGSLIDCQFSLPWVVALVTVNGRGLKVQDMGPFHEADPEVTRVGDLITTYADPRIGVTESNTKASLSFETIEGETYEAMTSTFYGSPDFPMSDDEMYSKFVDCASMASTPLPQEAVDAVHMSIMACEDITSAKAVGEMLAPLSQIDRLP
ncbi:MmgE/PrpD family protein [Streptomyces sp. NPDC017964]|uniref:MmgE/PrpD family protein n=1 Tax=Streptomyces sp. NPDC017964 TaxID=3365022 RepID=UPI0037890373